MIIYKDLKQADYVRTHWVLNCPVGTKRSDILRPEYWSHVAMLIKPHDRIEARCEDGSFFGEYLVLSRDRVWAKLYELSFHDLTQAVKATAKQVEKMKEDYIIKHRGPKGWSILRAIDQAVMAENLPLEEDAKAWLQDFLTSRSAA